MDAREVQPVKEEWFGPGGKLRFVAEYSDFGRLARGVPGQIIFKTSQPDAELRLFYKEMALNPSLQAPDLVLPRPPAVEEVPLGEH